MKNLAILVAATLGLSMSGVAGAAACKDSHGRFIKCPPPAAAPHAAASHTTTTAHTTTTTHTTTTAHVAAKPHAATSGQRCRNAKGQFAKCGTPGAHPA